MPLLAPISLEQITIASPCSMPWDEMTGDDRTRFCAHCKLHVYNISGMTHDEATVLIAGATAGGDRLCIRMYKRQDGTVLTRDCPIGLAAAREKLRRFVSAIAATLGLASLAAFAASDTAASPLRTRQPFTALRTLVFGAPPAPPIARTVLMGDVAYPAPAAPAPTPTRPASSGRNAQ